MKARRIKDGSSKRFHVVMQQHVCTLKSMGCETLLLSGKNTPKIIHTPEYQKLLDFINLRAQASEISASDSEK